MNFIKATGAAINTEELFLNYPTHELEMSSSECKELTGDAHRIKLAQRIFRESYKLIINDIIDNNVTFKLPTGSRQCDIHMQPITGDAFKNLRRGGKFRDVDFLKSLFTGNQLVLTMHSPKRPPRVKNIYVNKKLKDKITDNTNNGKTYC